VIEQSRHRSTQTYALLVALAHLADDNGMLVASVDSLQQLVRLPMMSHRTLQRTLHELVNRGELVAIRERLQPTRWWIVSGISDSVLKEAMTQIPAYAKPIQTALTARRRLNKEYPR
jgi:hypothetical protein